MPFPRFIIHIQQGFGDIDFIINDRRDARNYIGLAVTGRHPSGYRDLSSESANQQAGTVMGHRTCARTMESDSHPGGR